jgi:hypothetical protein
VVLGGGGGAGSTDDGSDAANNLNVNNGLLSSGAPGGGIFILRTRLVSDTGSISANGGNAPDVGQDGGGGGGAGGSVVAVTQSGNPLTGLIVSARGGNGGHTWLTSSGVPYPGNRHGPGGGGGGGTVLLSGPAAAITVTGGLSGTSTLAQDSYGAAPGADGSSTTIAPGDIPGVPPGFTCFTPTSVGLVSLKAQTSVDRNLILPVTLAAVVGIGLVTVWRYRRRMASAAP